MPAERYSWLRFIGLHPAAAFGVIAVDQMLFGTTIVTAGVGLTISIPVGIVLAIVVSLIQRSATPSDNRGLAVGKGILVGLLTAIPTALPSIGTAGLGMAGFLAMCDGKRRLPEP